MVGNIIYKTGNLLDAPEVVIAHCVNCRGGFGSGVAGQIARRWPSVKETYLKKFNEYGWKLGDVQFVFIDSNRKIVKIVDREENPYDFKKIVANLAMQDNYGNDGGLYVNYLSMYKAFTNLFHRCAAWGITSIAMPLIGAGLAGGDWTIIESIIEKCLGDRELKIVVYQLPP